MNDFHYKAMDWYDLLGFNRNEMNDSKLTREEYCLKYLEVAYQNCLSILNRNDLAEINSFYQIPTLNYCKGKIENIEEMRGKITEAYNTLKDPQKRKEYEFEIFGIFSREYPENETADEKFKDKAIWLLEEDDKWDESLKHIYWKNYLSANYWKNWREKITTAKYEEEIKFYITKFSELRMFILNNTSWGKEPWFSEAIANVNTIEKIKQKEIELQNMSKEEWWKEKNQPPRDGEWREMNVKEISKMLGEPPNYGWNFKESQPDLSPKKNSENQNIDNKKTESFSSNISQKSVFLGIIGIFIILFLLVRFCYFRQKKKR